MKKIPLILSTIFLAFISISLGIYNYYSLIENKSGHTGLDLTQIKIAYLLFSILSIIIAFTLKSDNKARKIFIITFLLSLLFIANIWIFEKTRIMLNYEDWIKTGM